MPRAGLTAERLTQAAAELADAEGLEAVTATAVARRFEVRAASIYAHVDGTRDLRRRVALLALAETADLLAAALAGRSGRDALGALGETYRGYAARHPGRWTAMQTRLDAATAAASAGPRHADLLRAVLRGYALDGDAQTHAVRLVGSVVHGFVDLELAGGFDHSTPGPASSWEAILDAVDHTLRTWTTPDPAGATP
ncbi:TetR-like C-terminal domain-containing protein [Phycicoccus ginsengisoli]